MAAPTVAVLARALAEWVARPGNLKFLHDEQLPVIDGALANPAQQAQLPVATWFYGSYLLARGQATVLDGDSHGWDEARIGLSLLRCSLLLRLHRHQHQPGRTGTKAPFPVLSAAHVVALGIALDDPDGEELFLAFAELSDRAFAEGDHWPLFVRELQKVRAGERPAITPRLGEYRDVLLLWHGDHLPLHRAMQAVLDHHLDHSKGKGAEFAEPWVAPVPLEIMAVLRVRQQLGLPSPKVEHALMYTHLVTMAPPAQWPRSVLVERLMQLVRGRR